MPFPWLVIFLFIFLCLFSVSLYFSFFSLDSTSSNKYFKSEVNVLPW